MRTRTILMLTLAGSLTGGVALANDASLPGLRVHVDPNTGEIIEAPEAAAGAADGPVDAETEGLVEEPAPGAAGGIKIDLRGRFRSKTRATVQPDGSIRKDCE